MINKLSFLSQVVVKDEVKISVGRVAKEKAPAEGSDIRVYHNGAVYPSDEFAKAFNLEFQPKVVVPTEALDDKGAVINELKYGVNPGMALDVFRSNDYPAVVSPTVFIMIAAIPRNAGRSDLFKGCDYNADGTPKTLVTVQGSTTFGKETLLPMLKEIYDIDLNKDTMPYVDMKVVGSGEKFDMPWFNSNGTEVYNIPKRVNRGDKKGEATYTRREKLLLWALVPSEWLLEVTEPIVLSGPAYREEALTATASAEKVEDDSDDSEVTEEVITDAEAFSPIA
jgi:hypothetical protein